MPRRATTDRMPPDHSPPTELAEPTRLPLPIASLAPAPLVCSAATPDLGPCPVCPHLAQRFEPFRRAAYWEAMPHKAILREAQLQLRIDQLEAKLRLREPQLFGTKTDSSNGQTPAPTAPGPTPKPKGHQRGKPSPKRRDHSRFPTVEEIRELPHEQQHCWCRGLPFESCPGPEESEVLEVEVQTYRRVIRRRRYRPTCSCGKPPGIVTAPPAGKVIPKSTLGVSIWVFVLLDKFLFYRPTYRLLADWKTQGLDLALGTLTAGLQRLPPLFAPVYEALIEHNQKQKHWHADETRWLVFPSVEGQVG